jgi:hypothetical protein
MRGDDWVNPAIVAKYRATPQFIKEVFKIIKPDPERERECEYELVAVLSGIEAAAQMDKFKSVPTPAQYKKNLLKLAKTLQDAIDLAGKAIPPKYELQLRRSKDSWIGEELKLHLKKTEQAINWISKGVRKGSPRLSYARIAAADAAYILLRKYGRSPTRVGGREGRTHKLAKVLFGNEDADLFDYLKRSSPFLVETGRIRPES